MLFRSPVQPPPGVRPDMENPLLQKLQHWWMGLPDQTGGLTLFDLVPGSLDHGTLNNMTGLSSTSGWSPATHPGGYMQVNVDGVNDFVSTPDLSGLTTASPFSLCAWVYVAATTGAYQTLISNHNFTTGGNYAGVEFKAASSGTNKLDL